MEVVLDSEQVKNLTLGTALLQAILKANEYSDFKCDKAALSLAIKTIYSALEDKKISKDESLEKLFKDYLDETDRRLPCIQIKLHPLDESIFELPHLQLYMHDYPKDKPVEDNEFLVKTSNGDYAILWYNTKLDKFLDPCNDWFDYTKDKVVGWLYIS